MATSQPTTAPATQPATVPTTQPTTRYASPWDRPWKVVSEGQTVDRHPKYPGYTKKGEIIIEVINPGDPSYPKGTPFNKGTLKD